MSVKKIIKEYFSYSTAEKRGLVVLVVILVAVYVIPCFLERNKDSEVNIKKHSDIEGLVAQLEKKREEKNRSLFPFDPNSVSNEEMKLLGFTQFQIQNLNKYKKAGGMFVQNKDITKIYGISEKDFQRLNPYINIIAKNNGTKKQKKLQKFKPFKFDPNTISQSDWIKLGVKPGIINRIKKYLATGARFKTAQDLAKIYGFDAILLQKLKPYIIIKEEKQIIVTKKLININLADTSQFKTLPGIGSVLSRRIIKYRNLLGGFTNKAQLKEVYGIKESVYEEIEERVEVLKKELKCIQINTCEFEELRNHPYITARIASDIIKYRERKGQFSSVNDLQLNHLLADSLYMKIRPYLTVD